MMDLGEALRERHEFEEAQIRRQCAANDWSDGERDLFLTAFNAGWSAFRDAMRAMVRDA